MTRTLTTVVTLGALIPGFAEPAQAAQAAEDRRGCIPALVSTVTWDTTDPLYLKLVSAATVKNCRKVIRMIVVETRMISTNAGLIDYMKWEYFPDTVHFPSQRVTRTVPYLVSSTELSDLTSGPSSSMNANCLTRADGKSQPLYGLTFYTVSRAYDAKGNTLLQYVSPPVECGQNG
jgi:hypothetical protein